jgi:hypothetical protein
MTLKNLKKVQNPKLSRTKKKLFLSSNLFFRQFKDEKKYLSGSLLIEWDPLIPRSIILVARIGIIDDFFSLLLESRDLLSLSNQRLKKERKFCTKIGSLFYETSKIKGPNIYNLESIRSTINILSKVKKSYPFPLFFLL